MIPRLATMAGTRAILDKYGLHARKRYGQNFLIREEVVEGVIRAAGITAEDTVLEVGPGIGTMTGALSQAAGRVICVEIDTALAPVLEETLAGCDNVRILWEDILKVDLPALAKKELPEGRFQVVANLPYYITTPILMELLRFSDLFAGITLMVQKEVAERICAAPGTPAYGAITPAVLYYAEPTIALEVPASAFFPRPQVDSAVLHLTMREKPPVEADPGPLFAVIRAAFMQRRKTLCNALAHGAAAEGYPVSREKVAQSLEKMGLPTDIRGEKLSLSEFAVLSQLCYDL